MRHMVTRFVMALVALAAFGCGGEAYEGEELERAEQPITARAFYGFVAGGGECLNTSQTCFYPSSRTLGVRLEIPSYVAAPMAALVQGTLTSALASFNAVGNQHGWSATQLFGAPASVANVVLKFIPEAPLGLNLNPTKTSHALTVECVSQGAALTETTPIPGTHRLCHKVEGSIIYQQVNNMSLAIRGPLLTHLAGATVLAGAGRGVTDIGDVGKLSSAWLQPYGKDGLSDADDCFLDSYGLASPGTITRSTFSCY